ncbi:MAG: hypothetical protein CMJ77_01435 [Planctomycetaceae bacterium]|nr:hypothetical protein [Planctomycetaceae bacterium]
MIAYLNGRYVDAAELHISPVDSGFMLGITIAEQLRTLGGKVFQIDQHLDRMRGGLAEIGLADQIATAELPEIIHRIVDENFKQLPTGGDLGITVFATPGIYPTYAPDEVPTPTLAVHSYPLPFQFWANKYDTGQNVVVVKTQQISPKSWPMHIKCRSRMHYYLADREAKQIDPKATALLLDENRCLSETPIANIVLHLPDEGLVSPAKERILPGVSLQFLDSLAAEIMTPIHFRDISEAELARADEIMLSSTPYCLLSVSSIQNGGFTVEKPGPLYQRLCRSWIDAVGFDFIEQAKRFAP